MKAIIHIGMPKTGTTALQHALFSIRETLLADSILYPNPNVPKGYNHGLLAGAAMSFGDAPREFRKRSPEEFEKRTSHFISTMLEQIEEHNPDLLILSSEYLHRVFRAAKPEVFREVLGKTGATTYEFLLYVRRPSALFLSACQQKLHASSRFKSMDNQMNRSMLDTLREYSIACPNDQLTVRLFDKKSLVQGDIAADFAHHYLPNHIDTLREASRQVPGNESFSAESMALLQNFRKNFFADQDDLYNAPTRKFRQRLKSLDIKFPYKRPTLFPHIRDYCDYADTTALILRDKYGIVFPDFDYLRLERGDFVSQPIIQGLVSEIVQVDEIRLQYLVEALRADKKKNTPELASWLEAQCLKSKYPSQKRLPFASTFRRLRRRWSRKVT